MQVFNNIRDEIAKNKEMKQNLEQFRAEKKKLEESDNLIKARQKLNTIESETFKVTQQAKSVVNIVMNTVKTKVNQASESDLAKKLEKSVEVLAKLFWKVEQKLVSPDL